MGQKDLTAKELESFDEVTRVDAKEPGKLRNQYSDVSKYEIADYERRLGSREERKHRENNRSGGTECESKRYGRLDGDAFRKIKIQYILENESSENYRLLLRKAGYEGAIYRNEYEEKQMYPVVILVLYWGDKKWKPHADLHGLFADRFENLAIKKYVDNVKLHIFPMAHLPEEVRQRFRSDMRIVVDYLAEGKSYKPTKQVMKHVGPVMRLLYALTGEKELQNMLADMQHKQEEGEEILMGEYYTTYFAKKCRREGRQEGIQEGRREGIQEGFRDAAEAFVTTSINRGSTVEYILDMVQECFKYSKEEAEELYRECIQ
ncbi:MAG: Rpn family recombination-promoting nuclease/putative transposase [Lachnospiraceae bacterium]|nr:Rpn family recombination-promoting nuclease/putative transposase [Lachnospiraceae bacterium]